MQMKYSTRSGRLPVLLGCAVLVALGAAPVQAEEKASQSVHQRSVTRPEAGDKASQTLLRRSLTTLEAGGKTYRVAVYSGGVAANTVQFINQTASGLSVTSWALTAPLQLDAQAGADSVCPSAWGQTLLSLGQTENRTERYIDVQCGDSVQVREVVNNG